MSERPRMPADFNNADEEGRIRLNVASSADALGAFDPPLPPGTELTLIHDDLESDGVLEFSAEESIWVARVRWEREGM